MAFGNHEIKVGTSYRHSDCSKLVPGSMPVRIMQPGITFSDPLTPAYLHAEANPGRGWIHKEELALGGSVSQISLGMKYVGLQPDLVASLPFCKTYLPVKPDLVALLSLLHF